MKEKPSLGILKELLNEDKKIKAPIKRVAFHEITKEAVEEALKHPRDIDTAYAKRKKRDGFWTDLWAMIYQGLFGKKCGMGFPLDGFNPLRFA